MFAYWINVLSRAFTDAFAFGKVHLTGTILTLIATVLAAGGFWYFRGPEAAYDKLLWFSLTSLAMLGLVFFLALTVFFARTPFVLHSEKETDLAEKSKLLDQALKDHESYCRQQQNEANDLKLELEKVRTNDPAMNIKKDLLKSIIADFLIVKGYCANQQKEAMNSMLSAEQRARKFVTDEKGDLTSFFRQYPLMEHHGGKVKLSKDDFDQVARICDARIQSLNGFLNYYG